MTAQIGSRTAGDPDPGQPGAGIADDAGVAAWSFLDWLGRVLHVRAEGLQPTLDAIARTATEAIAPAAYAGVNLLDKGRFIPQAVDGEPPIALDVLQQETGTGPCIDSSRDQ